MYLESIFIGSDDIRNQLPQEAKRFDTIDKAWLKIMADTSKNTNVLEACSTEGRCVRCCRKASSQHIATLKGAP
jgi:dynein heavy chain